MGSFVCTRAAEARNHLILFSSRLYALYGVLRYLSRTSEELNVKNNASVTRGGSGLGGKAFFRKASAASGLSNCKTVDESGLANGLVSGSHKDEGLHIHELAHPRLHMQPLAVTLQRTWPCLPRKH